MIDNTEVFKTALGQAKVFEKVSSVPKSSRKQIKRKHDLLLDTNDIKNKKKQQKNTIFYR